MEEGGEEETSTDDETVNPDPPPAPEEPKTKDTKVENPPTAAAPVAPKEPKPKAKTPLAAEVPVSPIEPKAPAETSPTAENQSQCKSPSFTVLESDEEGMKQAHEENKASAASAKGGLKDKHHSEFGGRLPTYVSTSDFLGPVWDNIIYVTCYCRKSNSQVPLTCYLTATCCARTDKL